MNQLRVDPASGFLESSSPNFQTFDADKKRIFMDLAMQSAQSGAWPDVNALMKQLGLSAASFYHHKNVDSGFCAAWEEVKKVVESEIAKTMHEHSKRPSNYMDRVTLLRHLNPGEWGGEPKPLTLNDFGWIKKISDALEANKPAVIATEAEITSTQKPTDEPQ